MIIWRSVCILTLALYLRFPSAVRKRKIRLGCVFSPIDNKNVIVSIYSVELCLMAHHVLWASALHVSTVSHPQFYSSFFKCDCKSLHCLKTKCTEKKVNCQAILFRNGSNKVPISNSGLSLEGKRHISYHLCLLRQICLQRESMETALSWIIYKWTSVKLGTTFLYSFYPPVTICSFKLNPAVLTFYTYTYRPFHEVYLVSFLLTQISNATQYIQACRHCQDKVQTEHQTGKGR